MPKLGHIKQKGSKIFFLFLHFSLYLEDVVPEQLTGRFSLFPGDVINVILVDTHHMKTFFQTVFNPTNIF